MKANPEWTVDINKDGRQVFTSYYCTDAWAKIAKIRRLPSWHHDLICAVGTGWWSFSIPSSKHNLNRHKMYLGKKKEEGSVVTRAAACQGTDLCLDYVLESCHVHPSLYPLYGRNMHFELWVEASLAVGGPAESWFTVGLWKTSITAQQVGQDREEELSESLSNNDFYKISKGEFILWKINAKLWKTGFLFLLWWTSASLGI